MPEAPLSLVEKLEASAARVLLSLPRPLLTALSLKKPIVIEGDRLDPEMQLVLALRERHGRKGFNEMTPEEARRAARREAFVHSGPPIEVGKVGDIEIPGPACTLRARHYAPPNSGEAAPLVV